MALSEDKLILKRTASLADCLVIENEKLKQCLKDIKYDINTALEKYDTSGEKAGLLVAKEIIDNNTKSFS